MVQCLFLPRSNSVQQPINDVIYSWIVQICLKEMTRLKHAAHIIYINYLFIINLEHGKEYHAFYSNFVPSRGSMTFQCLSYRSEATLRARGKKGSLLNINQGWFKQPEPEYRHVQIKKCLTWMKLIQYMPVKTCYYYTNVPLFDKCTTKCVRYITAQWGIRVLWYRGFKHQ